MMIGENGLSRSDLRMVARAIRNHWPVGQEVRERIATAVAAIDLASVADRYRKTLLETAAMMAKAG